jgi:hypothetical protein
MKNVSTFKRSLSGLDGSSLTNNSNFKVRYPVVLSYNCYVNSPDDDLLLKVEMCCIKRYKLSCIFTVYLNNNSSQVLHVTTFTRFQYMAKLAS